MRTLRASLLVLYVLFSCSFTGYACSSLVDSTALPCPHAHLHDSHMVETLLENEQPNCVIEKGIIYPMY